MNTGFVAMNDAHHTIAVTRMLDMDNPDMTIEMLLVAGPPPANWDKHGEFSRWRVEVQTHLIERYGWCAKQKNQKRLDKAVAIIERRMWDEACRVERELRSREIRSPQE